MNDDDDVSIAWRWIQWGDHDDNDNFDNDDIWRPKLYRRPGQSLQQTNYEVLH